MLDICWRSFCPQIGNKCVVIYNAMSLQFCACRQRENFHVSFRGGQTAVLSDTLTAISLIKNTTHNLITVKHIILINYALLLVF